MTTLTRDKLIQDIPQFETNVPSTRWINDVRIFAGFGLVFIHVCGVALEHVKNINSFNWWIGNYYLTLVVYCVPLFVMISGLLLLDPRKNEPTSVFYKKRASKIIIPTMFWTAFFVIWTYFGDTIINGNPVSIRYMVKIVLLGTPYPHMWFFYMIIGLYLFTPFLRKIIRLSSYNELLFLCIVLFAFSVVGQAVIFYYSYQFFPSIFWAMFLLPYFLAGYLINLANTNPPRAIVYVTIMLSVILTGVGNYFTAKSGGSNHWNLYFFSTLSITCVLLSVSVMYLLRKYSVSIISPNLGNRLTILTLGICLIHPVFLDILGWGGIWSVLSNTLFSIPLMAILVYILSLLTTMIIIKIPVIKRIV
ncbi:MAG: acyltransferase family protein [Dehalococcoidia bacterium]